MATIPALTNAETWPDADLDALRVAVLTEQERRYVRDFPWDRTEWADLNWGQPTPDWGIFGHGDMPKNYPL